jgi:hypothetical protein
VYRKALAEEEAEVRMTALMTLSRPFMPASLIAMTQGDAKAPVFVSVGLQKKKV